MGDAEQDPLWRLFETIGPLRLPRVHGTWEPELVNDMERFAGVLRVDAECDFRRNGLIAPTFLVYCTVNPLSGRHERVIVSMGLNERGMNDLAKNAISELVQGACDHGRAVAVVHVSEMWFFRADTEEDSARLKAWRAAHKGSFAGCPGVEDTISIWIETRSTHVQMRAPIVHGPTANRGLGAWEKRTSDSMAGRFTNFLTHTAPAGSEA